MHLMLYSMEGMYLVSTSYLNFDWGGGLKVLAIFDNAYSYWLSSLWIDVMLNASK